MNASLLFHTLLRRSVALVSSVLIWKPGSQERNGKEKPTEVPRVSLPGFMASKFKIGHCPPVHWMEFRTPLPPATADGDEEPERKSEPQFWTLFIENPRPNSIQRDNSD